MALIIIGGVSANEPSPSIHLLNLFQFPKGEYGEGMVAMIRFFFFLFAVINYGTDEI